MPPEQRADITDDAVIRLYNEKLLKLSQGAAEPVEIDSPDATARAVSPICGSEVFVAIKIKDNKISDFGFDVTACALTKTVVSVMRNAIIGKTRVEVQAAGQRLEAMLQDGVTLPQGDWKDLSVLLPVKDYKARHNAILLPFEAVEKAFLKLENR